MRPSIDASHHPQLRSWVESANLPGTDFPIQNLPLGVFRRRGGDPEVGVAIGDRVLSVGALDAAGLLAGEAAPAGEACRQGRLEPLLALGPEALTILRRRISTLLDRKDAELRSRADLVAEALVPQTSVEMQLPLAIGDYTDFYASIHHATNVGSMFRPDHPLLPNYKFIPVGYHGRASSVMVSGTAVRRPRGQTKADDADAPTFGPSRLLDYEVEVGFFVGTPNARGEPVDIDRAEAHVFGLCLVNDWSARDVQKWEYQPLGPFLSKSFGTTISSWVVTLQALAPFRIPAAPRPDGDPEPLAHLRSPQNDASGGVDLVVEAHLQTAAMRQKKQDPVLLSRGRFADMYWTMAQMLAHHTSNGCNLRPGDLLASGTVSGPSKQNRGCLLELTWRGSEPLQLPSGEERRFLADGDEVILRGFCERAGFVRIGFGECRGRILPAGS
jgi:fumarylacetoacetase